MACDRVSGVVAAPRGRHVIRGRAERWSARLKMSGMPFVLLPGFTRAPVVVRNLLMTEDPPILPGAVTHVWVASTWSTESGLRCRRRRAGRRSRGSPPYIDLSHARDGRGMDPRRAERAKPRW